MIYADSVYYDLGLAGPDIFLCTPLGGPVMLAFDVISFSAT